MEERYEQKVADVVEKQFCDSEKALTYLDSICWQIKQEVFSDPKYAVGNRGIGEEVIAFEKGYLILMGAVDLVARIVSRYESPVKALRKIDKEISKSNRELIPLLERLDGQDGRILDRNPQLTHLANRSLDFRLEELIHGAHRRSGNYGVSPNHIIRFDDEASPAQEKAIRALEEAG